MTGDASRYRTNIIRTIRGLEARSIAEQEAAGWELISQVPARPLRTELTFRKLKPKPWWHRLPAPVRGLVARTAANPHFKWIGGIAVLVILAGIITVGAITENSQAEIAAPAPATPPAPVKPSATTTPKPTPTPVETVTASTVTETEVVAAFQSFMSERATAGVVLAQTVTDISYSDRIVRITFDPAAAGIDQATFDFIVEPWGGNIANFAATAVAFTDDVGDRLRPVIDAIETVQSNGTPLGTYTAAQILALNGLQK